MLMNLLSALDTFLYDNYTYRFPAGGGQAMTGKSFYHSVIMPAMESPEFRKRLLEEPRKVLDEAGIALPEGVEAVFVENTENIVNIAIPPYIGD